MTSTDDLGKVIAKMRKRAEANPDTIYLHELDEWADELAAMQAPIVTDACAWGLTDDESMQNTWEGACGVLWTFTNDGPSENEIEFCMKCGRRCLAAFAAPEAP